MTYIITTSQGEELYHHDILGQKWGVRRYQNEDGTLTEAGKAKLRKIHNREIRRTKNQKARVESTAKNILQTKKDVESEGIFNEDVRSKYNDLRSELYNAKINGQHEEASMLQKQLDTYAQKGFGGEYITYATAALNGIKNEYISDLEKDYEHYIKLGQDLSRRNNDLMNLDVDKLLNSNAGYKELRKEIRST